MKHLLFATAVSAVVLGFSPMAHADAYGLTQNGQLYTFNESTGAETLDHSIGTGSFSGLASKSGLLYTVRNNMDLCSFSSNGTATFQRSLPFIGSGICRDIAIDGSGVGWAAVNRSGSTDIYSFGLVSGETLRCTVPSKSISAIDFSAMGSLYAFNATALPSEYGLHVINKSTGAMTKVNPNALVHNTISFGMRTGLGGFGTYFAAFNDVVKGDLFTDNSSLLATPNIGIQGLDFLDIVPIALPGALGTVNFGAVASNPAHCLEDSDNVPLKFCKAFVPNFSSPLIRFEMNFHVGSQTATLASTEVTRMSSGGSFQLSVEYFNQVTSTFAHLYNRSLSVTKSAFIQTVPLSSISGSNDVKMRFSVVRAGFSAVAVPCAEFDVIVLSKTLN